MPETLKRLAFHPLLLTLILNHYGAHKRYPHKLSDLFEGWIAKLLDAPSQAPSHLARLRQALVALAQATASGPISMADAMHCIANLGLVETVIDELASLGAVTADFLVELRHEALADYLRVQALMVGDEQGVVKRIESVDIQQGSLFPAFMIERATAAGAQRACWQRLSRHRLSD